MKKKLALLLTVVLTLAVVGGTLTGCGDKDVESKGTIIVGASSAPHAEILEAVRGEIEAEGYQLEIKEFSDYVIPNTSLEDGSLDANYFQHLPYLEDFNAANGTSLSSAGDIHYEPLGLYKGTAESIDALKKGDKIAVPNDKTNEARALQLLAAQGIITIKEGKGLNATKLDIESNPLDLEIVELDAAAIPRNLSEVALAVINGNYAISSGLSSADSVAFESADSEAAKTYANILAVRTGDENAEKTQVLLKALTSETAKKFIEESYDGAVVALF